MVLGSCLPTTSAQNDNLDGNDKPATSSEELDGLRKVFDTFDENHDGFLTLEELCKWMKKLGLQLTREGLLKMVRSCDWDEDGRLDFKEFVALTETLENEDKSADVRTQLDDDDAPTTSTNGGDGGEEMREAFRVFDKDGNGLISPAELGATLSELGLLASSTSLSRIHSMIRKVDADGDGEVSFSEFEIMMKKG